jgi:hypothetical protein
MASLEVRVWQASTCAARSFAILDACSIAAIIMALNSPEGSSEGKSGLGI